MTGRFIILIQILAGILLVSGEQDAVSFSSEAYFTLSPINVAQDKDTPASPAGPPSPSPTEASSTFPSPSPTVPLTNEPTELPTADRSAVPTLIPWPVRPTVVDLSKEQASDPTEVEEPPKEQPVNTTDEHDGDDPGTDQASDVTETEMPSEEETLVTTVSPTADDTTTDDFFSATETEMPSEEETPGATHENDDGDNPTADNDNGIADDRNASSCGLDIGLFYYEPPRPLQTVCTSRPYQLKFTYKGGLCNQSNTDQIEGDRFLCEDFQSGPTLMEGESSYIVVTQERDDAVFFSGRVTMGETFSVSKNFTSFPAIVLVRIFRNDDTEDPRNILQVIQIESTCKRNLFLFDRFGALELAGWWNDDQGYVSRFANQSIGLELSYDPQTTEAGLPAIITTLEVHSNMEPFVYNLSSNVMEPIFEGSPVHTNITVDLDLTMNATYELSIILGATSIRTGEECRAERQTSFVTGQIPALPPTDAPSLNPTDAPYYTPTAWYPTTWYPTQAPVWYRTDPPVSPPTEAPQYPTAWYPTQSPVWYPTDPPDPYEGCTISADISCSTSSGQACDYLVGPSAFVCDSYDGVADSVSFMVTGNSCGYSSYCEETFPFQNLEEQEYYILVYHRDEVVYEHVTGPEGIFTLDDCHGVVSIVISTVTAGEPRPGLTLQVIDRVPLTCLGSEERDVTLMQDYGALRVVSFSNPTQGVQAIMEEITLTYTIRNHGLGDTKVEEALTHSDFEYEMIDLMEDCEDPVIPEGGQMTMESTQYTIHLANPFRSELLYYIQVAAAPLGSENFECYDRARIVVPILTPFTTAPVHYQDTFYPTYAPTFAPTDVPWDVDVDIDIRKIVSEVAPMGGSEWRNVSSYQAKAIAWLERDEYSIRFGLSDDRLQQRYALACIYFATYGVPNKYTVREPRGWIQSSGWLEPVSECEWFGLSCVNNSLVESMDLDSNRVTGSFPNETAILAASLTRIDLFRNSVYNTGDQGHMWLAALYKLRQLFLGHTNFEYDNGIPPYLMELTSLAEFVCSNARYSGPIDGEIFLSWQNMEWLSMGGNAFNSSIPIEIGLMTNLQYFYMQDSYVVGDLTFLEFMEAPIVELWIHNNPGLGGTIPSSIANAHLLKSLQLSGCSFTGPIPTEIGALQELHYLWLYDNYLSGTIPYEMGNLFQLQSLEMEENHLSGVVPEDLCLNRVPMGLLQTLEADCGGANNTTNKAIEQQQQPELFCSCCTCCQYCAAPPEMITIGHRDDGK